MIIFVSVIYTSNKHIDAILDTHKNVLGIYYEGYRNHVYRVYNVALQLCNASEAESANLAIAAAYHDIGIWTNNTFDYLSPSVLLAADYASKHNADTRQIADIINNHHKLTVFKINAQVEAFRKADLIDLSLNLFRLGIKRSYLRQLNKAFPGKGFHRFIFGQILKNSIRHPLNPLPIVKW